MDFEQEVSQQYEISIIPEGFWHKVNNRDCDSESNFLAKPLKVYEVNI